MRSVVFTLFVSFMQFLWSPGTYVLMYVSFADVPFLDDESGDDEDDDYN